MTPQIPLSPRTRLAKCYGSIVKGLCNMKVIKRLSEAGIDPTFTLFSIVSVVEFCEGNGVPLCEWFNSLGGAHSKCCCFVDETPEIVISGFPNRDAAEAGDEPLVSITAMSRQTPCQKCFSLEKGLYDFCE